MFKVETLEEKHLEIIASSCTRDQFQFGEYSFLNDRQLAKYLVSKALKSLKNIDTIAYVFISENKILGMLVCVKDVFDSGIFGFNCYRITDLLVFSQILSETNLIIHNLIFRAEKELIAKSHPVHLTFSLNNNIKNVDHIFNAMTDNKYYYIHTLLTFNSLKNQQEALDYYPEEKISIRVAKDSDSEQIADLARKSFKYSRFHLDPFLDNTRSNDLLSISAFNSIRNGFVDVMFVAEMNDKVVGYYSGNKNFINEFNKTVGNAVISAVDEDYRGLGIFSKLDSHLLNWFGRYTDFAEMGTYLINYPIHRTWINKKLSLIRGTHQFSKYISNMI